VPSPSPSGSASRPAGGQSSRPPGSTGGPISGQSGGGQSGGGTGTGGRSGTGSCTGTGTGTGAAGAGAGAAAGRASTGDSLMSAQQQLTNARLALQLAQDKLTGTTIAAPIAGKVLSVAGTVGAQQSPDGSGFIVLGDLTDTAVRAQFSEADVASLAVGQPATITLPNQDSKQVQGKVSQIDPAGTTSGRLVRYGVLVAFDAVPADLLLGESANVAVTTASAGNVLYVPSAGVTATSNGVGTVTVRTGGHDERRTVRIGLRGDQDTEIQSGLGEGDELVTSGTR
jgi:HlyD family secretion protein